MVPPHHFINHKVSSYRTGKESTSDSDSRLLQAPSIIHLHPEKNHGTSEKAPFPLYPTVQLWQNGQFIEFHLVLLNFLLHLIATTISHMSKMEILADSQSTLGVKHTSPMVTELLTIQAAICPKSLLPTFF